MESEEIKHYYNNKIKLIMGVIRYSEKNNILITDTKIKSSIRIYDYELGILLLRDQLKNKLYESNLYICNSNEINIIFEKIKKYFDDYDDYKKIINAYFYSEYVIGTKI